MKKPKTLFSVTEVAKIMRISRVAVFRQIKTGKLTAEKVGHNYVITRDDLNEAMGVTLSDRKKEEIAKIVEKAVREYGTTFRRLGREE